jgi:hypothetical protein
LGAAGEFVSSIFNYLRILFNESTSEGSTTPG